MLSNQVRIIGGKWRSRKLSFPSSEGLRPTSDRLRETLFNWLSRFLYGAVCLDVFAGSGALGFEALSRGAKRVIMLEKAALPFDALQTNAQLLQAQDAVLLKTDARHFLKTTTEQFDVIFLDPPFKENMLEESLIVIQQKNLLAPEGKIYIEYDSQQSIVLPQEFCVLKKVIASQVTVCLIGLSLPPCNG